jgi:hypothetical protein
MRAQIASSGFLLLLLGGCSPTLEIGGAYFPGWLVSAVAGLVAVGGFRAVLLWCGLDEALEPRSLAYPAWAVFFTLLFYLLLFS